MSRKQKKKDAREQSTRQLMGIDDITQERWMISAEKHYMTQKSDRAIRRSC